ncbi:DUF4386 domain-containing protein [Chryseolinea lacunae]|uniref:DUF4386 domain-containing protein n=1 Tax=Chryseolinea lacunae TaxID=2801331 RepID=A0ABS1KPL1_9BACT|nr:DUF4386 domain-containing protein [Chryseolinea lacunae]MBL0740632.1 DUF4386 domain-containing protein [Chryseolinea lacunae]
MSTAINKSDFSPQSYARVGGVLYLIIIIAGIFGEFFVRGKLFVPGDATATAHQIAASPLLWRIGICADLIMQSCDIPLMLIFYVLLRPINRNLALLNLLFNVIQTAVLVANKLNLLMALFLLSDAPYLQSLDPTQLHALSYLSIKLHDHGFGIGLIFFGFVCLVEGYLIFKSGYFPKTLGVLMQVAGVCYLINTFSLLLAPKFASQLFPFILMPCFIAELSLGLWMLVKGVNLPKWKERVG